MDAKSVALIAERMKWSHTDENGPEWYVTHENYKEYDIVAETNSVTGEWHLTSAGAWECMIEFSSGGVISEMIRFLGKVGDEGEYIFQVNKKYYQHHNERTAIALAALAMIEEDHE